MSTDQKLLERLAKLMAMANGTDNEEEADAFFGKAHQLMFDHAVSEADIDRLTGRKRPVVSALIETGSAYAPAKSELLNALCSAYRCKMILIGRKRRSVWMGVEVFGREDDVTAVQMLYASLQLQMLSACDRQYHGQGRTWKNNFYFAYAGKIAERLEERNEVAAKMVSVSDSKALAVMNDMRPIEDAFRDAHPHTVSRAVSLRGDTAGQSAGFKAGINADIGNTRLAARRGLGTGA